MATNLTRRTRAPRPGENGPQVELLADGVVVSTQDEEAAGDPERMASEEAVGKHVERIRLLTTRREWTRVQEDQAREATAVPLDADGFRREDGRR